MLNSSLASVFKSESRCVCGPGLPRAGLSRASVRGGAGGHILEALHKTMTNERRVELESEWSESSESKAGEGEEGECIFGLEGKRKRARRGKKWIIVF